ncbi:MAG: hypothetical protein ACOCRB_02000 [Halanaerobiaceae bacterium]
MEKITKYDLGKTGLISIFVTMVLLLSVFSVTVLSEEGETTYETDLLSESEEAVNLEDISGDLIYEIINFVHERDSVLDSQRKVIELLGSEGQTELNEGEDEEELPEYIRSSLKEEELNEVMQKQEIQEKYTTTERKLTSELLKKLSEIFTYKNEIENQKELHELLLSRENTTKRQVEAGILEPQNLQDLSEEIIAVRTAIADAELNMRMLKMEIAFNYGGSDWQELIDLINELEESLYS